MVESNGSDFLGVKIDRKSDGLIHLTQPHLINSILKDLHLLNTGSRPPTVKMVLMATSRVLSKCKDSEPHDGHFDYHSVIGKLLYLEKSTRPDLAYGVHQYARFAANPHQDHAKAVKWIGRYFLHTKDKGMMILCPTVQSFDCYVDADFSGN